MRRNHPWRPVRNRHPRPTFYENVHDVAQHLASGDRAVAQAQPYSNLPYPTQPASGESDLRREAWERAASAGAAARRGVEQHPIATVAMIAGLAFALGALWKIGRSRRPSGMDSLLARLSSLPSDLPRRWRI
jgi:hypothetical protein